MRENLSLFDLFDALSCCEGTRSRLEKESALSPFKNCEVAKQFFDATFNPYTTYGIVKFAVVPSPNGMINSDVVWDKFSLMLRILTKRELTGDAARREVEHFFTQVDERTAKWLKRVLMGDLRCGVSYGTVNKIWPGLIPSFNLQLCETYAPGLFDFTNYFIELKYKGIRGILRVENGVWKCISRGGKPLWNVELIADELLMRTKITDGVFDGELYAGTQQLSLSITKTQTQHPQRRKLRFFMFDFLTLKEFDEEQSARTFQQRRDKLAQIHSASGLPSKYSTVSPGFDINSEEEALEATDVFITSGYEGAVAKKLNSLYTFDRSAAWIKIKEDASVDCEIIGVKEGSGRLKGTLGSLIVLYNGKRVDVGGKMSDLQRRELWMQRNEIIGMQVEVLYASITPDKSLEFPRFSRLRDDL